MTYIAVQICVESRVSNYLPRHNLDDALLAVVCALLPLKMPFKQWYVPFASMLQSAKRQNTEVIKT